MATPAQTVAIFQKRIATTLALYDELILAVDQKKKQKSLETMLAEQCVLGLAVLWEAFIHDLIVSYIEQNPESCIRFHSDRVTQSVESKSKLFAKWVTVEAPDVLSRVQIELLVDPDGWNITADSAETLAKRANQFLDGAHAIKFSLADVDRAFVDFLIATRNYLSHRSAGALTIMKKRVKEMDAASLLNGNVTTVGAFLKAKPPGSAHSRAKLIGHQLSALATKLM
jgi:hypothetical protein